jgi:hypothetical protein
VLGVGIGLGVVMLVGAAMFIAVINIVGSGTGGDSASTRGSGTQQHARRRVRVEVLNASRAPKAAAKEATILGRLGYVITGTGDAPTRRGNAVECNPQLGAEARTLAQHVGPGTVVVPRAGRTLHGTQTSDCTVLIGR